MSGAKAKIISHSFQTVKNIRGHSIVNCKWKLQRTGLDQFRNESSLSTWIYRIATNECLRLLNSRKEEVISAEDVQEELMSKLKASDYVDYEDELAVKFQEAILTLPEKQRIVFNLRYYDELEYEDIARVLDSKVETLKVNYHYAKDKIKEYILNR